MYLGFAKAFDLVNHRFLLAKLESFSQCEKIRSMDQILLYLMGRTNRVHVADARDKDQEWGVSDWASSIFVVCYRPPECHQYDNGAFRRRRYQDGLITLTKWSYAELSL